MKNVIPEVDSKSMDIVADNIRKLRELFPEAFTEGKVDFDALKEVLGDYIDGREERYSFTWNGKSKARMLAQTPSIGTLRPCKEESVDWDNTQNLFIEGDNLEVLKLLQKSYHKKIKMIYIDPPYNTGKDFVYKDNFKDNIKNYKEITGQVDGEGRNLSNNPETSGRYHTDWLNMMYPRLKLSRGLLSDDGLIFISIDDNEVSNLIRLCNEVYGEENFVGSVSWLKKRKGSFLSKKIVSVTEWLLVYGKTNSVRLFGGKADDSESQPLIKRTNQNGVLEFPSMVVKTKIPDGKYDPGVYGKGSSSVKLINPIEVVNGVIVNPFSLMGPFIWGQSYLDEQLSNGARLVVNTLNFQVRAFKAPDLDSHKGLGSFINGVDFGATNEDGYEELRDILGAEGVMSYPKPVNYIKYLVNAATYWNKDAIVLDFFAGSSTSAHAVMKLNSEDGGRRRAIMVQLPEKCEPESAASREGYLNIAEIAKERIHRSADKIKDANPDYQGDLGFKVFKLDSTNIKPWELDFDLTEQDMEDQISNIKHGRKEEDVLYEVLLKYGLDLSLPITEHSVAGYKVFDIGMGALIICLSDAITLDVVGGIAQLKDELNPEIMRVVFKDAGFSDDVVKTNAVQILKQAGIEDVRSL